VRYTKKRFTILILAFCLVVFFAFSTLFEGDNPKPIKKQDSQESQLMIPQQINYQGFLSDNDKKPINATLIMYF